MVEPGGGGREGILPGSPCLSPGRAAQLQLKGRGAGPPSSGTELGESWVWYCGWIEKRGAGCRLVVVLGTGALNPRTREGWG